jgi:hypothetical protein
MSQFKGTPGPWRLEITHDMERINIHAPEMMQLATVRRFRSGWPIGETEANARLIAAAPDLLQACELLLAVYAPLYSPTENTDAFSSAVIKARGAITKATNPNPPTEPHTCDA